MRASSRKRKFVSLQFSMCVGFCHKYFPAEGKSFSCYDFSLSNAFWHCFKHEWIMLFSGRKKCLKIALHRFLRFGSKFHFHCNFILIFFFSGWVFVSSEIDYWNLLHSLSRFIFLAVAFKSIGRNLFWMENLKPNLFVPNNFIARHFQRLFFLFSYLFLSLKELDRNIKPGKVD